MLTFIFDDIDLDFAFSRGLLEKLEEEIALIMGMQEHYSRPTLTPEERAANEDVVNYCAANLATLQRRKSRVETFLKNAEETLATVLSS
ncbi:Rubis-subs-bind domain-containing protein [Caenorhabditis elegans]|uniref:Rubis-subs-bind domain-containing protein n=1 Tax=Caenorhabditis elegans TaxID=6239 RepID=O62075_CAEEL|nr:Rubis-subs-bind domain-containing protein [Caenorhabditis elegans]CAB03919.3 Rubis-subs-bind domain-containing protein [Caenorhabditis elegans]|eukprot:NP_507776.3 Uncharacterized protein CELE_C25F9.6 [Caenorhabditis elegans]